MRVRSILMRCKIRRARGIMRVFPMIMKAIRMMSGILLMMRVQLGSTRSKMLPGIRFLSLARRKINEKRIMRVMMWDLLTTTKGKMNWTL